MRILTVPKNTDKKYSFELFELLRKYQNDVMSFWDKDSIPSIRIFSVLNRFKNSFGFKTETIANKLDAILAKDNFDFFWNLGLNREYLHVLAQRATIRKVRFIQSISDDALIPEEIPGSRKTAYRLEKIVKFYEPSIDLFLVHSRFIKDILMKNGIDEGKIVHVSAFVDALKYKPCYKSEDYCIYRYRKEDRGGVEFLIDAMKKTAQHKLIIVSDDNKDPYLKEIKKKCNINNVLFVDNFSHEEKENLLKMARFAIVFSDLRPQEILENYAIGKPVLAINSGSNEEYLVNAYSGLLFNFDLADLSGKIDYLMQSPDFCREAGKFARSLVQNCFDKQNHYGRIFNAIHTIPKKELLRTFSEEYLNIS